MSSGIRAFAAIPMPDAIRDRVRRVQARCKQTGVSFRAVRPESVHLTLHFFQAIPKDSVASIASVIELCTGQHPPLEIRCRGFGVFPGLRRARVLWLGVSEHTGALVHLHDCLRQGLIKLGHRVDARAFRPHLTVGRTKGRNDPEQIAGIITEIATWPEIEMTARRLVLYQSRLTPSGAVHTPLADGNFNPVMNH